MTQLDAHPKRAFISHATSDDSFVVELKGLILGLGYESVFNDADYDSIAPDQEFWPRIEDGIRTADALVVIISAKSTSSGWVTSEVQYARSLGKSVLPILIEDCTIPELFRDRDVIDFRLGHRNLLGTENSRPKVYGVLTGPLTLGAKLKESPERIVDAYPTGKSGVHFVFDIFNGNAFDFLVSKVVVEVFAYKNLALDELIHGVGATDVKRFYHAKINPELGRYSASYLEGRPGEYIRILAKGAERFDVEITTTTEGLYSLRLYVSGGAGGKAFDFLLDGTEREIAFFDENAGYLINRGHDDRGQEKWLSYSEYVRDVGIKGF